VRTRSALLMTLGLAMTLLVLAGTASAAAVVVSLVVPTFLGIAAAIMVWLGVLYVRRRRERNPWNPLLTLFVGIEVLAIVAVAGFLFPRLPAIAPWTAGSAAIAAFVALVLKAAPTLGWDQDPRW
jgi:hypothetical protein